MENYFYAFDARHEQIALSVEHEFNLCDITEITEKIKDAGIWNR